ncbi:translation initiation factor eIF-2B [Haladaptatus sp. YSMS36]|uniref:translation initiation factor eIF-2B n=1 Tax=Haladaptatus sp. YSMS36 TaxID=3033384 RepID=UPI0023E85EC2|nr:hypothetical protein [Haladaptatus sp. YSMS36]
MAPDLTVETIREDRDHGSAQLSLWALDVLRDAAAHATAWDSVAKTARELVAARPSMVVIENRVNRVMHAADHTPDSVADHAKQVRDRATAADVQAAAEAATLLDGGTICTLSRSGTVARTLEQTAPERVVVAESRPGREGVGVAEKLADETAVTLVSDAGIAQALAEFDASAVLVGADTVLPDGSIVNKVGTRTAASTAVSLGIPFYAVCSLDKVSPRNQYDPEPRAATELYDGEKAIDVSNPTFDRTPPQLVRYIATEAGPFDTRDVATVALELGGLADW